MNIYNLNNNINDNVCLDYEPFLIEAQCKSFCNDTNENDILSLLKPYFGRENYTTFDKYISNCMIIPGQNKAIIQINDRSFGNFIFENYQVLNKDFPLIYKGNPVRFIRLETEMDYNDDNIMDSDGTNSTKLTSSPSWNIANPNENIDNIMINKHNNNSNKSNKLNINFDKILDEVMLPNDEPASTQQQQHQQQNQQQPQAQQQQHNIALYGWTPHNKLYGNEIALNLPKNVVNKILVESKINNIPPQSFCLMVGFLTHNGPMSLNYFRQQKIIRENQLKKDIQMKRKRAQVVQQQQQMTKNLKIPNNVNSNTSNNIVHNISINKSNNSNHFVSELSSLTALSPHSPLTPSRPHSPSLSVGDAHSSTRASVSPTTSSRSSHNILNNNNHNNNINNDNNINKNNNNNNNNSNKNNINNNNVNTVNNNNGNNDSNGNNNNNIKKNNNHNNNNSSGIFNRTMRGDNNTHGSPVNSPRNNNNNNGHSTHRPQIRMRKRHIGCVKNPTLKLTKKLIENGFKTPVVMINNLNENRITCDKLFVLCGVFGDVIRVKISYNKRDTAFVQLINHDQAKNVINSLNRIQLFGKMIYVNLSRIKKIKLPKDSPNSAMKYPDRKYLTKNYVNSKKHRYNKKNKMLLNNIIPLPSNMLYVYNLPNIDINIINNKLINFLNGNDKIKNINIINDNNPKAFIECYSLDFACQILIDNHLKLFYGNEIKISFAKKYNNNNNHNNNDNDSMSGSPRDRIEKKYHIKKRQMKRMNSNNNNNNGNMYAQVYRKKE